MMKGTRSPPGELDEPSGETFDFVQSGAAHRRKCRRGVPLETPQRATRRVRDGHDPARRRHIDAPNRSCAQALRFINESDRRAQKPARSLKVRAVSTAGETSAVVPGASGTIAAHALFIPGGNREERQHHDHSPSLRCPVLARRHRAAGWLRGLLRLCGDAARHRRRVDAPRSRRPPLEPLLPDGVPALDARPLLCDCDRAIAGRTVCEEQRLRRRSRRGGLPPLTLRHESGPTR